MHRDGLIVLPPPKGRQYRPRPIVFGHDTEPPLFPAPTTLDDVRPLDLRTVVRRRLPQDWTERYHTTPVLIETFVETPRYTGAVYRASGWIHVGATQGRGRYDRHTKRSQPRKDIWLRPLRKDWMRTLNR